MRPRRKLESALRRALAQAPFSASPVRLLVAVSGGPDSMALLHGLAGLSCRYSLHLHVAHLDHALRGDAAESDSRFVQDASSRLDLPCTADRRDVSAYQKRHRISSWEMAAREVRYHFLSEVASQEDCRAVALGHTADDQAETVLMNLLRGAGLHGLRGMEPVSQWRGPRRLDPVQSLEAVLFRPLLSLRRADTMAYCSQLDIPYRQDATNRSDEFTRPRIRHELLPNLHRYNPRATQSLLRASRSAALAVEYLEGQADAVWGQVASVEDDSVALDALALGALHAAVTIVLLRRAFSVVAGGAQGLTEDHLLTMARLSQSGSPSSLDLPGGLTFRIQQGRAVLGPAVKCPAAPPLVGQHPVILPGVSSLPGWRVTAEMIPRPATLKTTDPFQALFDFDRLGSHPVVRGRGEGDRFWPLGMPVETRLKDFFINQKVPSNRRDAVPLLVADRGIIWVVGIRPGESAKITAATRRVLMVRFVSASQP